MSSDFGRLAKQRWTRDEVRNHCIMKGWDVSVVHQLERHTG